jgi:hypothetical protein
MMLRIDIQRLGAIYYHILLCLLRFLLCPPNEVSGDILCLLRFLSSPQTKFGDLLFLHRFLLSSQTKFGNLLFLHRFLLLLLLLLFLFFFFSLWACPTKFSETNDPIFTKLHRKVYTHLKRCTQVLEFSKWPPLPWKPWAYVTSFDLTYIGNRQRDFHKTWHIY